MEKIRVMVNGLPGNMAAETAAHILKENRFTLLPYALTGPEITEKTCTVNGHRITLFGPENRDAILEETQRPDVTVDYTHPTAVNANADWYCRKGLSFVMGTTGGDRKKLTETVLHSEVCAVIAPNMAKQIVAFQAMMAYAADHFPGLFNGYTLTIRESHQKGKADTSGTAKAMVSYFNQLGIPFSEEQIQRERDPVVQREEWKIPETCLAGHGWHTYSLTSADETVHFQFTHNVNGRKIYALGTLDAVAFLSRKILAGEKGKVYSMIDVLKGA